MLKVQEMLHICSEHAKEEEKKEEPAANGDHIATDAEGDVTMGANGSQPAVGSSIEPNAPAPEVPGSADADAEDDDSDEDGPTPLRHQGVATIGIALIAMGEEVGAQMALRQFQHLVSHAPPAHRAVLRRSR